MEDPLLCFFPETEFTETKISRLYGQYGRRPLLGAEISFPQISGFRANSGTRAGLTSFIGSKMVLEIYNFQNGAYGFTLAVMLLELIKFGLK
jgi:hypothetical protein